MPRLLGPYLLKISTFILFITLGFLFFSPTTDLSAWPSSVEEGYPVCRQSPLEADLTPPGLDGRLYLPLIVKAASVLPACTVYCGLSLADDSYRPAGYRTYFADEFDCNQLLPYWLVQPQMTAASYIPPASGYVQVRTGTLQVGVPGRDVSFPYLYLIDNRATTYDVPYLTGSGRWAPRVDWLPDAGDFRIAMRVRFNMEAMGEHRISIYADGHRPAYAGPLFYVGTDYNDEQEAWRGLIVGADQGLSFVDLGEQGYTDPYTDWVVVTIDFNYSADLFRMAVDDQTVLLKPLSSFAGAATTATRPDILYIGSLAVLPEPVLWSDIELDWLRVYAPLSGEKAPYGLLEATLESAPVPTGTTTLYSAALPPGAFQNVPYWSEHFTGTSGLMPAYWQQLAQHPNTEHAWTEVHDSWAMLRNDGQATQVPVWMVLDDMLPDDILGQAVAGRETPVDYLRRRGGSPFVSASETPAVQAIYSRFDWRPEGDNIRYAWRARQSANGYGVEISNCGHFPFFTGAMFYTLQDTTTGGGRGQFIFPGCQEQYFWRLHRLSGYQVPHNEWMTVNVDYLNGTVHLYVDGQEIGWWPESDCSLNWYLKGKNATSPDVLFFGNPATAPDAPGSWSEVTIDWFATFPGLPRTPPL